MGNHPYLKLETHTGAPKTMVLRPRTRGICTVLIIRKKPYTMYYIYHICIYIYIMYMYIYIYIHTMSLGPLFTERSFEEDFLRSGRPHRGRAAEGWQAPALRKFCRLMVHGSSSERCLDDRGFF